MVYTACSETLHSLLKFFCPGYRKNLGSYRFGEKNFLFEFPMQYPVGMIIFLGGLWRTNLKPPPPFIDNVHHAIWEEYSLSGKYKITQLEFCFQILITIL